MSTTPVLSSPEPGAAPDTMAAGQPAMRQALRVFAENRLAAVGLGMIVLIALFCFLGPHIWHTDQIHNDILNANQHPSRDHPLGTDPVGYDVLGRLMVGGQTSLEVAFGAAVLAVILGTLWGAIAGYVGGMVDGFMMRVVDALLAIPALFLLLFLAAVTTPSVWMLIFVLGGIAWLAPARLVRGEVLTLRTSEYVQATRVMGGGPVRIVLRHIVPNTIGVVVVNATFQVADAILIVAALSFLGLGIPPPAANWGGMLTEGLNFVYSGYWWLIYPPGIAIVLTVVAFNFIGDALRDAFEVPAEAPVSDTATATTVIEVRDLRIEIALRHVTIHAVDGVSFDIDKGETIGLVGESGCGKTTTGLGLLRLLPPGGRVVGGSVRLAGQELTGLRESELQRIRGRGVGVVFQDPMTSLNPTMTIGNQVAEPLRIHRGASARAARTRAAELLGLVGLPSPQEQLDKYPHELSGGMRQRVGIAGALACDPSLLVADEPTTALDVTIQDQILELFGELRRELGMAVLLITHDLGVVAGQADRVLVMYAGRIVESGPTDAVYYRTRHRYTEALLQSIPRLETSRDQPLYSIPGLPPDLAAPPAACRFAARCRFATDICRTQEPPLVGEDDGHAYACFHPAGIEDPNP